MIKAVRDERQAQYDACGRAIKEILWCAGELLGLPVPGLPPLNHRVAENLRLALSEILDTVDRSVRQALRAVPEGRSKMIAKEREKFESVEALVRSDIPQHEFLMFNAVLRLRAALDVLDELRLAIADISPCSESWKSTRTRIETLATDLVGIGSSLIGALR